jgi:uncharacterized damage-inducible protein DinB
MGNSSDSNKDERAALLHFLGAQRAVVQAVVADLAETAVQRSVVPSGWTPLSMLVHLADVERHWFAFALGGDVAHTPVGTREPETLSAAVEAYRAEIERSDRLLAKFSFDDSPAIVPSELPGEIQTVRDIVLHVIEEVARHAGHLDLARELIDGRTGLGPR